MKVNIIGPMRNGSFNVHKADCAGIKVDVQEGEPWLMEVNSQVEVADEVYADIIAEHPNETGKDYLGEFNFKPCCKLPVEK